MNIKEEKKKHLKYLKREKFIIDVPFIFLSTMSRSRIENNGHWYEALINGDIKPVSKKQIEFIEFAKGNFHEPRTEHEIDYFFYKKAKKNWGEIFKIIDQSTSEERNNLSNILNSESDNTQDIITSLIYCSSNPLATNTLNLSYSKILESAAEKLKIDKLSLSNKDLEKKITLHVFNDFISKLSPEEIIKFEKELTSIAKKENSTLFKTGSAIATLTAANLSGFGIYMLATTTLSTISGIIGITFPFIAYTTLTSFISIVTGPAGWIATGIYALWKIVDVNYNKLIPAIIYISWLREKYSK